MKKQKDTKLLGRHKTPCLSCGFEHVHVKSNEGKHAYLHCPECGLVVPTRNNRQAAGLMAGLRPEKHTNAPELARRADDIIVPKVEQTAAPSPAALESAATVELPKPRTSWGTLLDSMK